MVHIDPTRTLIEWPEQDEVFDHNMAEAAAMNYALPWALVSIAMDAAYANSEAVTREAFMAELATVLHRFQANEYTGY